MKKQIFSVITAGLIMMSGLVLADHTHGIDSKKTGFQLQTFRPWSLRNGSDVYTYPSNRPLLVRITVDRGKPGIIITNCNTTMHADADHSALCATNPSTPLSFRTDTNAPSSGSIGIAY